MAILRRYDISHESDSERRDGRSTECDSVQAVLEKVRHLTRRPEDLGM